MKRQLTSAHISRYSRVLCAVIAFQLLLALVWMRIDRTPPYWDEAWYLYQGAAQHRALSEQGVAGWFTAWTDLDRVRPSLVSTLTVPFFALFGVSDDSGLLVNLVALGMLLLATYALGTAAGGKSAGLLSAIVVGSYPVLIGLAHILLVEMVMVALVAVTLLALWRSKGFGERGWSCIAGLATGLGLLTKVFFIFFVAGPWLVAVWISWRQATTGLTEPTRRVRMLNLAIALLVALALAGTWYVRNLEPMITRSISAAVGAEGAPYGPTNPFYWRSLLGYLLAVVGLGFSPAGFLLLVFGIAGLVAARTRNWPGAPVHAASFREMAIFLASSAVLGYAVFTSLHNQDIKQVTGILPATAVLTGWGLTVLAGRRSMAVTVVALAVMIAQVLLGTLPGPLTGKSLVVFVFGKPLMLFYPAQRWSDDTKYAAPNAAEWPIQAMLQYTLDVVDLETLPRDRVRVAAIPDSPGVEEYTFRFEAYRRDMPVEVGPVYAANLDYYDILIDKTGSRGWVPRQPEIKRILSMLGSDGARHHLLPRTFPLPDGSEALLYGPSSPLIAGPPQPANRIAAEFGGAAGFLGYDYQVDTISEDGVTLRFTCYWESLKPTQGDYSVFIHFIDPSTGDIIAQADHLLFPRTYPTSLWQPGRYLRDSFTVFVPGGHIGESFTLRLGLYRDNTRLPLTTSAGIAQGSQDFLEAGTIRVRGRE